MSHTAGSFCALKENCSWIRNDWTKKLLVVQFMTFILDGMRAESKKKTNCKQHSYTELQAESFAVANKLIALCINVLSRAGRVMEQLGDISVPLFVFVLMKPPVASFAQLCEGSDLLGMAYGFFHARSCSFSMWVHVGRSACAKLLPKTLPLRPSPLKSQMSQNDVPSGHLYFPL